MNEKSFKEQMKNGFDSLARNTNSAFDWQLHEDMLSVGIPDISWALGGQTGWIEAKWTNLAPKREAVFEPDFRPFQEAWLVRRGRAGGCAHLVWGFNGGYIIASHYALLSRTMEGTTLETLLECGTAGYFDGKFDVSGAHFIVSS